MDAGAARARLNEIDAELLPLLIAAYDGWAITRSADGLMLVAHRRGYFLDDLSPGGGRFRVTAWNAAELWVRLDEQEELVPAGGMSWQPYPGGRAARPPASTCDGDGRAAP